MIYDREKAVAYAKSWWNKRNPEFYNFDSLGGDCTNFISQCLFYGGYKMKVDISNGWFYKSLNYRSPSFTGVNEMYQFLLKNKDEKYIRAKIVSLNEIEVGDLIQIRQNSSMFTHTLLVTKIDNYSPLSFQNVYVSTHTYDCFDRKLSTYSNILESRFLKLY